MNTLEAYSLESPFGKTEECAKFVIDDTENHFGLYDITSEGQAYSLSLWIRAEAAGRLAVAGKQFPVTTSWKKYNTTFTASGVDLILAFGVAGTYYIYHPKLEIGNKATDWSVAPEDVDEDISEAAETAQEAQNTANTTAEHMVQAESMIQQLADSIKMLVTDENGQSLMTQTSDGWTFCTKDIQNQVNATSQSLAELVEKLGSAEAAIQVLSNSVDEFGVIAEFVHIGSYTYTDENGTAQTEPSIDLFETDTGFKLKITNTRIVFTDGTMELLTINSKTKSLNAPKVVVENELQIGSDSRTDGAWIWKQRTNGNLGLMWKGVSS